jgi:hypothetical protein
MKKNHQKEYTTKNSKVIRSIIDLKVETRLKITWKNQYSLEHDRINDPQPLHHDFLIKFQEYN